MDGSGEERRGTPGDSKLTARDGSEGIRLVSALELRKLERRQAIRYRLHRRLARDLASRAELAPRRRAGLRRRVHCRGPG
jgi:hypothetical protein